jgi:folate-dependent phosphoribosylglycinamide formyltransferase PurN
MTKKWIAFFSQTGSEIVDLIKATGYKPDVCVTNNVNEDKYKVNPELISNNFIIRARHDRLMEYFIDDKFYDPENTVITLHGYLRILPPQLCAKYRIYNGHPGAIELYPELKGKDPQERAWENRSSYKFIGSVVHEVVPEVDEGKIVKTFYLTNRAASKEEMYKELKMSSLSAWTFALKEIIK